MPVLPVGSFVARWTGLPLVCYGTVRAPRVLVTFVLPYPLFTGLDFGCAGWLLFWDPRLVHIYAYCRLPSGTTVGTITGCSDYPQHFAFYYITVTVNNIYLPARLLPLPLTDCPIPLPVPGRYAATLLRTCLRWLSYRCSPYGLRFPVWFTLCRLRIAVTLPGSDWFVCWFWVCRLKRTCTGYVWCSVALPHCDRCTRHGYPRCIGLLGLVPACSSPDWLFAVGCYPVIPADWTTHAAFYRCWVVTDWVLRGLFCSGLILPRYLFTLLQARGLVSAITTFLRCLVGSAFRLLLDGPATVHYYGLVYYRYGRLPGLRLPHLAVDCPTLP
jgi:hypothetical protein